MAGFFIGFFVSGGYESKKSKQECVENEAEKKGYPDAHFCAPTIVVRLFMLPLFPCLFALPRKNYGGYPRRGKA